LDEGVTEIEEAVSVVPLDTGALAAGFGALLVSVHAFSTQSRMALQRMARPKSPEPAMMNSIPMSKSKKEIHRYAPTFADANNAILPEM